MIWDGTRLAIGTLTTFPVRAPSAVGTREAGLASALAPIVGGALGLFAAIPGYAIVEFAVGPTPLCLALASVITIATLVVLTRGLHWDGIADVADSLGVRGDRARRLEVMRESTVGSYAVVAIVALFALQVSALALGASSIGIVAATVITSAGSRLTVSIAAVGFPAARPEGLGAAIAHSLHPLIAMAIALTFGGVVAAATGRPLLGGVITMVAIAVPLGVLSWALRALGGLTGDVIGASIELSSAALLITLAVT